jgi:hypothetical protein
MRGEMQKECGSLRGRLARSEEHPTEAGVPEEGPGDHSEQVPDQKGRAGNGPRLVLSQVKIRHPSEHTEGNEDFADSFSELALNSSRPVTPQEKATGDDQREVGDKRPSNVRGGPRQPKSAPKRPHRDPENHQQPSRPKHR